MKPRILSLAAALLVAVPALEGCAEEAEAGEAAYPPIGYTPPGDVPTAGAQATPPPPPERAARAAPSPGAPGQGDWAGARQWAASDDDAPPSDQAEQGDPGSPGAEPGTEGPANEDGPVGAADGPQGAPPGDEPPAEGGPGGGYADTDPAALSDFRSTLEPYGAWTDDPAYGTVWVPSPSVVGSDFTPYVSAGHWTYDSDYAWVSDYDWGWAPFHYGRWVYASGPGWEWVPGRTYAGAWVSWRYGAGDWAYVGWAPLAPTWCWRGGVAVGLGYVPRAPYAFVGTGELFAPRVGSRVIGGPQVGLVASHTRPYVPSSPSVGSRIAARPSVGGPPPSDLHLAPDMVAHAAVDNRGLAQARAFARPSSAVALGARGPAGLAARSAPGGFSRGAPAYSAYRTQGDPSVPHFGGRRLGGGFAGSAAAAPPMRSYPSYGSSYGGGPRPYFGSSPRYSAPSGVGGPSGFRSYSQPARSGGAASFSRPAPNFSGFRGGNAAGGFHGGNAAGGFHGGGVSGGYHGGGGSRGGGHR